MELMSLMDMLEEVIENSPKVPLSSKVMIDKDEIFELIKDIRLKMPDEIKKAEWVNDKRDDIIKEAKDEADDIVKSAEDKFNDIVSDSEITRAANEKAQQIIDAAKDYAKELRLGARDYADNLLADTEKKLKAAIDVIQNDRGQL